MFILSPLWKYPFLLPSSPFLDLRRSPPQSSHARPVLICIFFFHGPFFPSPEPFIVWFLFQFRHAPPYSHSSFPLPSGLPDVPRFVLSLSLYGTAMNFLSPDSFFPSVLRRSSRVLPQSPDFSLALVWPFIPSPKVYGPPFILPHFPRPLPFLHSFHVHSYFCAVPSASTF